MRRWPVLGLLLLLLALAPFLPVQVACAQGGETATATPEPSLDYAQFLAGESEVAPEPSLTSVLLGVVWKLGLVVLLAYGALWAVKRFSVRRVISGGQQMQVVETVGLGQNRSLHLVRVGAQVLLIGATPQEVRTLADVTDAIGDAETWSDSELPMPAPDGDEDVDAPARTLMPSFEAIERVRRLWRRGEE
ncbi:MAG: flagellar biosynthetic protein FliO [Anaerolineae bacterium]